MDPAGARRAGFALRAQGSKPLNQQAGPRGRMEV
jgi:hypothetical protein